MHIVLVEPEIPPNTGNVARLCAATRTRLHLIEPLGFRLDDAQLKRAGMDYWQHVDWRCWANWAAFTHGRASSGRFWFIESGGPRETAGLPRSLLEQNRDRWLTIPMFNPEARSLNLSNCVALVLFEALRQQGFPGGKT